MWNAPYTCNMYLVWSCPALFCTTHVYIPLSDTAADRICRTRPARSSRTWRVWFNWRACPSFNHVTSGSGTPRVGLHSMWTRCWAVTVRSVSVRLFARLGGTSTGQQQTQNTYNNNRSLCFHGRNHWGVGGSGPLPPSTQHKIKRTPKFSRSFLMNRVCLCNRLHQTW